MFTRRTLLQLAGASLATVPFAAAPTVAMAQTSKRFVLLLLRGGADGLHMVAPYADRDYRNLRPTLALHTSGAPKNLDLDGYFAFHPAMAPLATLYQEGELSVIPAATTRYRDRSHFDGQNLLENGSGKPYGASDGWLNRAVAQLNTDDNRIGLALGPSVPLILQGDAAVQTWANSGLPEVSDEFLFRLAQVYAADEAFAQTLAQAQGAASPMLEAADMRMRPLQSQNLSLSAQAAADLLARRDGPRIAVLESQGWDTHFDQERRLSLQFAEISKAIVELRNGLGLAWKDTVVLVVSEFGRTAAENGSRGSDHGTGGIALLTGGAVNGGKVLGEWPGLSKRALFEGRDVRAVNPYEAIFKTVLISHMGLSAATVEDSVFPNSRDIAPAERILRA